MSSFRNDIHHDGLFGGLAFAVVILPRRFFLCCLCRRFYFGGIAPSVLEMQRGIGFLWILNSPVMFQSADCLIEEEKNVLYGCSDE